MVIDQFKIIVKSDDGTRVISDGDIAINSFGPNDVLGVYMVGKCRNCSEMNVLEGDFIKGGSTERSQGPEVFYSSTMYSECSGCDQRMRATADFSEYPKGPVHTNELELERNVDYVNINGLEWLFESGH